jgi:alcohol dehydrogenase class IV
LAKPPGQQTKYGKTHTQWNMVYDQQNDKILTWTQRDVFKTTDDTVTSSLYTKNPNVKIHSHVMPNPSKDTGKAAAS